VRSDCAVGHAHTRMKRTECGVNIGRHDPAGLEIFSFALGDFRFDRSERSPDARKSPNLVLLAHDPNSSAASCPCGIPLRMAVTHGMTHTLVYRSWHAMRQRCSNPKSIGYPYYGGRGIRVCKRWQKFENFFADMGDRPTPKHTIDRINVNGDYEPSNCRWALSKEQAQNTTQNVRLSYGGETLILSEWSRRTGIRPHVIGYRLRHGWSAARALGFEVEAKNTDGLKNCPICNVRKKPEEFGPNRSSRDGLQGYCKPCRCEYKRQLRRARAA
jgi:hypothetical protein